jgi:hypothetical protein
VKIVSKAYNDAIKRRFCASTASPNASFPSFLVFECTRATFYLLLFRPNKEIKMNYHLRVCKGHRDYLFPTTVKRYWYL